MFAMLLALGARTSSDVTTVGGAKGCAMAHGRIGLEISWLELFDCFYLGIIKNSNWQLVTTSFNGHFSPSYHSILCWWYVDLFCKARSGMQRKMVSAFFHLCRRFRFLCRRFFFLDLPFGRNFQPRRLSPTRKSSAEISAEGRSRYFKRSYLFQTIILGIHVSFRGCSNCQ